MVGKKGCEASPGSQEGDIIPHLHTRSKTGSKARLKSSKPAPSDLFPKEGSTSCMFYNLPNSTPSWEPSVQTYESTGAFHIQTTMGRKLLKKADEQNPCSGIC